MLLSMDSLAIKSQNVCPFIYCNTINMKEKNEHDI
jgi:hypothetical protein